MSLQDPISDMLTRIRNALMVSKKSVTMPGSKRKTAIAEILKQEGFITDYQSVNKGSYNDINIELKYHKGAPVISQLNRISKPSIRIYEKSDSLPQVKGGLGIVVVSTSQGLMTARQAKILNLGGEVVCSIS